MGFKVDIRLHKISTIIHGTRHAKHDRNFWQGLALKQRFLPHTAITSDKTPASLKKKMLRLVGLHVVKQSAFPRRRPQHCPHGLITIKTTCIIDRVSAMARVNSIIKLSFA